jgi:hypothetical protein
METFGFFLELGIYFSVDPWKDVRMREIDLRDRELRMKGLEFRGEAPPRDKS